MIGDVTGDGVEDIVYGGNNQLQVMNGNNGNTIATYTQSRISQYCQPQLYDVDGDGVLEILVPLYYQPGLAAVKYDGDSTLQQLWITTIQQGSDPLGSVMAKPVAGDIDGDGNLDIFLASQDVSPLGGYDGTIVRLDHEGNILAQSFSWRACSGGLSLADTDNDGVFEVYQGDRDMDYSDGGYGKGEKSYWADDLTERWIRLDDLTSSQAPALADVNGDGIKDVITGMYRVQWILNSTNGQAIQFWSDNSLSVHYGTTVYDIDGDGHLELLCNDGDHDDDAYTDVFDLVTGEMDAQLSMGPGIYDAERDRYVGGDTKWSPVIADIDPTHPGMEIISVPNGTGLDGGQSWNGAIMIWSNTYESLQNVTRSSTGSRLGSQLGYSVIQDIDNDGLLELVTHASSGTVYAFDTIAPAPGHNEVELPGTQRIRSEVTYYGEARLGVAEHTIAPWEEDYWTAPLIAPISPAYNSLAVPISTTQLSFQLRDHQSEALTYSVTSSPDIGSASGSNTSDTYDWNVINIDISGLAYDTTYKWTVTADDGVEVTSRTYTFRTELAPNAGNSPPTQENPDLVSLDGLDRVVSVFQCSNQTTTDTDGDDVTNIYRWTVNDEPVAQLLLPFDTKDETSTTDYSGFNNDGAVTGATWVPNGVMGGAYSFDGQDDAIVVSDGGVGYFDGRSYSSNNEELGGFGNWDAVTVEAWVYLDEFTNGSTIVGKIPSYALGFQSESGRSNRLYGAVWPYTGEVADDDNQASVDRMSSVTANVNLDLKTWYHIAFTYEDGVGLSLYLNGELVGQSSRSGGPLSPSRGEPLYIGRLVQPFAGMIDDVRLCNYAQPAGQIYNYYMETKDGNSSSSLFLPMGIASKDDEIGCDVIPTDSYAEGTTRSASITILNTPPNATNLNLYPLRDRAYRLDNENLESSYDYYDADGDLEFGTQTRWYKDDVLQSDLNDHTEVPASSTNIGEAWYFTIQPMDGEDFGDLQTSETITIRGNTVPDTGTPTLDSINGGIDYNDEDLIGTAGITTDADTDSTTNIFHWTKNGVSTTNLQMPFDTEVPTYLVTNGVTNDYSGYGNDGSVNGSTWIQDGIRGGAFSFDGNDYITVQEQGNSLGGDGGWSAISAEFWVKATGTTSTETAIFLHDADFSTSSISPYGLSYRIDYRSYGSSYRVYWYIYNGTSVNAVNFRDYVDANEWHHVVCTYEDGVGLKLYMDGILRESIIATGPINATVDDILSIGGYGSGGTDFSGLLDEVRIYPTALSAAQVFQRYVETKEGLSDSETIEPQVTSAGDAWVCQVVPNDSWEDGTAQTSETLTVADVTGNSRPHIDWYSPTNATLDIDEGDTVEFMQVSSDPDVGDGLTYSWTLDTVEQATSQNWTYTPDFDSQGPHTVRVTVSDGSLTDYQEWTVNVADVTDLSYLTILASPNGTTDPEPQIKPYRTGRDVSVLALPDLGYSLDHWLLDSSDVGSANPYVVTMDQNHELQPIFTEITDLNLTINIVGSGSVTKDPDQETYNYGDEVELTATHEEGSAFIGWSGDAQGTDLIITIEMTDNMTITATFVPSYVLEISVQGEGTTDPEPGMYAHPQGEEMEVEAIADPDFKLDHWLLNGENVGDTNPYPLTLNEDTTLEAVFIENVIFSDGFESGDFSQWSGVSTTSGETATVATNMVHHGIYASHFTTNGQGGVERAHLYKDIDPQTEVYVRAYFNMQAGLPLDAVGNRFNLFSFMSGSSTIASMGVRNTGSTEVWYINSLVGAWYGSTGPEMNQWYSVEFYIKVDSTDGVLRAWVNGDLAVEQTGINTATLSSTVNSIRYGLVYVNGVAHNIDVYGDCVKASSTYIGPEETQEYNLIIQAGEGGTTNPAPDTYQYVENSPVEVETLPSEGYVLDHWLLNDTNVGSANPYALIMTSNYNLTAVFVEAPPPVPYNLHVEISGSGTTNATGDAEYTEGTVVAVQATADSEWKLDHWLLNGTNVGSANPYIVTMDANYNLTSVFTEIPTTTIIFQDDFESGNTNKWDSTTTSSGEAVAVTNEQPHQGTYSLKSTSNGDGSYEYARLNKAIDPQSEVYVNSYFKLTQNGIGANGQRIKLVELRGSSIIAAAGLWQRGSTLYWWMETRNGASYVESYTSPVAIDLSQWFSLELRWKEDATAGGGSLLINGVEIYGISNADTDNYGDCTSLRFGLAELNNCASTTVYADDLTVSTAGGAPPIQYLLHVQFSGLGSTNATGDNLYDAGTFVAVQATADAGYVLDYWLLNDTNVGSANPYALTMDANYNLTAVFVAGQYNLHVEVTGSGTTNATGDASYDAGTVVTVQATPETGWILDHWLLNGTDAGSANPYMLTMNDNYDVVAVFEIPPEYLFEDGFESGFTAWTSTYNTAGETITTTTDTVYAGTYSAQFTSNGDGGYEKAYTAETFTSTLDEVYVQGYLRLQQNGIIDSGDRIKLIELRAGSAIVASAGLWQRGSILYWWMETRNGASYVESYTSPVAIDLSQWFSLELSWTNDAVSGGGSLWINGTPIYQISNADTDNYGGCSQLRLGLAEAYNCANNILYVDQVKIDLSYINP